VTTPKTPVPGFGADDGVPGEQYVAAPNVAPQPLLAPPPATEAFGAAPPAPPRRLPVSRFPRPSYIGLAFLLLTIAGFVALGAALPNYTLSSTARRGLTYDTLFAELHDAMVDEPDRPLRREILALQVDALVPTPNGYVAVTYDTLGVAPDGTFPSLQPGGFLRDEIDRFNAFQRERIDAVRRGRLVGSSVLDLRAAENSSIFRTEIRTVGDVTRGERDSVALAERAVPYSLRVPSPFDAARLVAVTTREWSRNLAWISPRGTQPLGESGRIPGEPPCPFRAVKDSVYIECTAPGSPFSQLVLRFPDRLAETGTATSFTSERTLYDGSALPRRRTMPIGTGGMFQFHSAVMASEGRVRPEPVILEWALAGTLGGTQWINGRIRWQPSVTHTSPFVKQLASAAGFGASVELEGGRNIPLSLDESLTDELQHELEDFSTCAQNKRPCRANGASRAPRVSSDIHFATVVLASARSGEILAVAEYGPPASTGGSWILKPVNVGSAIKPVLATAALMRRPELASLEVWNSGPAMDDVWGIPLERSFESGASCPAGWINLRLFLSCSSNRYAAALVAMALQPDAEQGLMRWDDAPGVTFRLGGLTHSGQRPHLALDARRMVRADTMNASALASGLFALDSLNTSLELAAQLGREGRDSSVWMGLRDDRNNPVRVPLGLWPEQSRLALSRGTRPASMRQLTMFSVGASENRITTLDLTESIGRILTDRQLSLRFVVPPRAVGGGVSRASFAPLGLSKMPWYSTLVGGLRDVGLVGTARGTQDAVAHQLSPSLEFYGKSGTLNAPPHVRTLRRTDTTEVNGVLVPRTYVFTDTVIPPVVAKTLTFGLGVRGSSRTARKEPMEEETAAAAMRCGIVGTVYFRLRRNPPQVESLATEFANERLWRVLRRHWQRLRVC
jgi:hypothetical protein